MGKATSRNVSQFRQDHVKAVHIPAKILAALNSLRHDLGDESYEYEDELAARAKISSIELRGYREKFKQFVVEAPTIGKKTVRYAWFASVVAANKARKED